MKTATQSKVKYRPLQDHILIKRLSPPNMSPGGIMLPDQAQGKSTKGIVLAVGQGIRHVSDTEDGIAVSYVDMDVEVGDVVLFGIYMGNDIPDEPDLLLLRNDEILAIVLE
jgi:chaperonin GroES